MLTAHGFSSFALFLPALAALAITCLLSGAHAGDSHHFTVGGIDVWAIADSRSDRDAAVFREAATETVARYIPTGKTPSAIMTFLLRTGDELVLVDAGLGEPSGPRASRLTQGLRQAGFSPEEVDKVLVTHMHADHIGGLLDGGGGRAFPNATVLIGKIEYDFWLNPGSAGIFPARQHNFDLARRVVELYLPDVEIFAFEKEVAPGVVSVNAVGHTPGHAAFLVQSEGERLLVVGDMIHAAALQFPRPDINAYYDMFPDQAAATRRRLLELSAREGLPLAGMHFPFPGVGMISNDGLGGFIYQPEGR